MKARELMTKNPVTARPEQSLHDVALLMKQCDCGCVPVEDPASHRILGVLTDRDIVLRAVAEGKNGEATARDVMTSNPSCCSPEDDVKTVERVMSEQQVRRVPIVDRNGRAVGIVAQADLARAADGLEVTEHELAEVVEKVSEKASVQH